MTEFTRGFPKEQGTHNPLVAGSNPAGPTIYKTATQVRFSGALPYTPT